MSKLTPKQEMFAEEFLIDLNATQAAIRAGYSKRTARSQAQRLLTNVDIAMAIDAAMDNRRSGSAVGYPTFGPQCRQWDGFRPFKRSGLNSRFVPTRDIARAAEMLPLAMANQLPL